VPAKVHGHDVVAFAREMLELRREVGMIAGYTVDQQDGQLIALCLLVKQSRSVSTQGAHATPLPFCCSPRGLSISANKKFATPLGPVYRRRVIHPTSWKRISANFALTEF